MNRLKRYIAQWLFDFMDLSREFSGLETDLRDELRSEISELRHDLNMLQNDVDNLSN